MTNVPSSATARPKILVVDDDNASRRLLAATLTNAGFDVTTARDGKEAVHSIDQLPLDLVVLDFEMPRLNGAEVCARIRSDERPEVRDLPVLMLTAHTGEEDEVACLQAGANDFVTKPVSRAVLTARIQTQLRLRSLGDALRDQNEELARWRAVQMADLEAAKVTQEAIIPQSTPRIDGWAVETTYSPVIQVGGDLYGWRRGDDGDWLIWLVDATGHGVAAALFTTLTALSFQHACAETRSPGEVLARVNDEFCNVFRGRSFMTACCVRISPSGQLVFAGAGHPPLLIRRVDGRTEEVAAQSTVLGIRKAAKAEETTAQLQSGDTALLYTDGLYSLMASSGERMRCEAVREVLSGIESDGQAVLATVQAALAARSDGQEVDDDVAAISLTKL